jgi:response regulator of citrate/malate metabolism
MKIWLIEDSEVYRRVLGNLLLTCTPYRITKEFCDKLSILKLMDELSADGAELPDLFLLDIYLPDIHGWQVLDKLMERRIEKPVIIISQSSNADDVQRSKAYPNVIGYFIKSDFPANLFAMIDELDSKD